MSRSDNNPRIAHELSNLLDGSMRNLRLALATLRDASDNEADLIRRLETVHTALNQMGQLTKRWLSRRDEPTELYDASMTISQCIEHAVNLVAQGPMVDRIAVTVDIDDQAACLPAGPIYPVVANALRNSFDAIGEGVGQVDVAARLLDDKVVITVSDDGPGVSSALLDDQGAFRFGVTDKATGHGLGLTLSRDIARSLAGSLTLCNRPDGGAVLTLACPADALGPHHPDLNAAKVKTDS